MPFEDLAYRFTVSIPTISHVLSAWMVVMDATLLFLLFTGQKQKSYGKPCQCVFNVHSGTKSQWSMTVLSYLLKAQQIYLPGPTFSSYKHHNTIKILRELHLKEAYYVSETWVRHIWQVPYREPSIFTTFANWQYGHGKIGYSGFTKRKSKKDLIYLRKAIHIASVCIHVERVITLLWQKYFRIHLALVFEQ